MHIHEYLLSCVVLFPELFLAFSLYQIVPPLWPLTCTQTYVTYAFICDGWEHYFGGGG